MYAGLESDRGKPAASRSQGQMPQGSGMAAEGNEREDEAEETDAPFVLNAAMPAVCTDAEVKEKQTQPPKPYTEGTLLKAMESAGKQIEDEELREAMKDSGLGTPATRAATIERLKQVGYIEMQGKRLAITRKGRTAIELVRGAGVELLASPEMTGHWERRLNEIARGQASAEKFMDNVKRFAAMIVERVRSQQQAAKSAFAAESRPVRQRAQPRARQRRRWRSARQRKASSASSASQAAASAAAARPQPVFLATLSPSRLHRPHFYGAQRLRLQRISQRLLLRHLEDELRQIVIRCDGSQSCREGQDVAAEIQAG